MKTNNNERNGEIFYRHVIIYISVGVRNWLPTKTPKLIVDSYLNYWNDDVD